MGTVYVAEHERLGILKAVKILLPEFSQNASVVRRFETEAMAAARIKHRNIIGVDDFGQLADGQWYIVMPFLEGASLERFLVDRGRLTIHQTLHLMAQVSAALQAAHDEGIVHRDLKPPNVFISHTPTNPFHITLLDFGIAKLRGDGQIGNTETGTIIGTPLYMAAELFEDSSRADARSDIFALGVMTYQLVSGDLPFGSFTAPILYNRQLTERPTPPAHVPQGWVDAIMAALALRPDDRPQSARAFALALASATQADPPYEPSGAEIVTAVAPELLSADAYEATVKNASEAGRIAVLLWPRPETPAPMRQASAPTPSRHPAAPAILPTVGGGIAPVYVARTPVYQAPIAAAVPATPAATPTTLSGASGPISMPARGANDRRYRPLVVTLGFVAVGLVVAIVTVVARDHRVDPHARATPTADAPSRPAVATAGPSDAAGESNAVPRDDVTASTTGKLVIETKPAGASLVIDGAPLGVAPQEIERAVGKRLTIRAELKGHRSATQTHTMATGSQRIQSRLVRRDSDGARSGGSNAFDPDDVGGD